MSSPEAVVIIVVVIFCVTTGRKNAWDGGIQARSRWHECSMCAQSDKRLDGFVVKTLTTQSALHCLQLCMAHATCSCFNYVPGVRSCQLNAAAPAQNFTGLLTPDATSVFYARSIYQHLQDACKDTMRGKSYIGNRRTTVSGRTCQHWNSYSPHNHTRDNPDRFPDSTLAEAENFCRNPDGEPLGPWCYTMHAAVRWEYCQIPFCPCTK